jgi:hypothetical protein
LRRARSITTLGSVEVGDHVCWPAPADEDFGAAADAFIADAALCDDKVLILGPAAAVGPARAAAPGVMILDPGTGPAGWDPVCDLVQIRSDAVEGTTVRLHTAVAGMEG